MQRFKNILCVVERSDSKQNALQRSVDLAASNQAMLTVIEVIPPAKVGVGMLESGLVSDDLQAAIMSEHKAWLASLVEPYRERINIQHKILLGIAFIEVIREVLRYRHDLVIKCPESPDWLDRFLTGDDMHLLRKCPCPVWLIKSQTPKACEIVLAAVDVDDFYTMQEQATRQGLNIQILNMAASLALAEFAELHIVHAWEPVSEAVSGFGFSADVTGQNISAAVEKERRQQQQLVNELIRKTGADSAGTRDALDYLKPRTHLVKGPARKEVPALAKRLQVDCIVMGTVARTGIRGFIMGNTAETILAQIDCSVLAIKPDGFVTPVTTDKK